MQQAVDRSEKVKKGKVKAVRKRRSKLNKNHYGYYFIAPFFIVFLIFGLYPILYTLYLSFTQYDGFADPTFIGTANYLRVFQDPQFYAALQNTIVMWVMGVIPQFVFAFLLSAVFSYNRIKGKGILRALYYLPRLVTAVSISALFNQFLSYPSGLINQVLMQFGWVKEPINFLSNPLFTQGSVGLIHWWMFYGNTMILVMAGMTAISSSLYEAARIDGANSWHIFWKITMSLLKPITLYVFLNSLIGGLQSFDVQQILTGGQGAPQGKLMTVVMYLYNTAFQYNNYGYSAAIAYYLFAFIALASSVVFISRLRGKGHRA
jgi:multiple sugar transport system permease protein